MSRLDAFGIALLAFAIWSIIGIIVALWLNQPETAQDFLYALAGAGVTLIGIDLYKVSAHG